MSNKSGVSDEVISLPSGGGAVSGIGGSVSTDRQTGSGSASIPIELPPGRNDAAPNLSLTYRSGNGNGPFGMGWALGTKAIGRKTDDGVPQYRGGDTFLLGGTELVAVGESENNPAFDGQFESIAAATHYQPKQEGAFARITRYRDAETDHWTVETPNGGRKRFGTPGHRRDDPATISDPDDPNRVFAWELTESVDPHGNQIEYRYRRDEGHDGSRRWDALYPAEIRYAEYADNERHYLVAVRFDYHERPDSFSNHRAGFEIHTRLRCESVGIWIDADDIGLVRRYDLRYHDERDEKSDAADRFFAEATSLLASVKVTGVRTEDDETTEQRLPASTFEYATFDPSRRDLHQVRGDYPRRSLAAPELELADLDGNGLPDLVEIADIVRCWPNLGDGEFGSVRWMNRAPAGLKLADPDVQLMDADGDGRIDLLANKKGLAGYFPLEQGEWSEESFQRYRIAPSVGFDSPNTRLLDLDGDGVTDALRTGSRFECFFNDSEDGWGQTRQVPRQRLEEFPDVSFSDERVQLADLSGDGLQDIVLVHDRNVEYWPNLGHGNWGGRVHMRNSPQLPHRYDPRRFLFGDVDGDGFADCLYVDDGTVTIWRNAGGHTWTDPLKIDGTPRVTDADSVRLVDLLGTGIDGILWTGDETHHFLDLTGETKPHLLIESDNGMGASTRVAYAPSTTDYLAGERGERPAWKTKLPFPKWVVTRVETKDRITGATHVVENEYRHGHYDGADREFCGFGAVVQRDAESFDAHIGPDIHDDLDFNGRDKRTPDKDPFLTSDVGTVPRNDDRQYAPPREVRTWYHVGPVGPEHGGWHELDYGDEYWEEDPSLLERPAATEGMLSTCSRQQRRTAIGTLRGRTLRTEVYGLDESPRADRPYGVTERNYGIRYEQSTSDTTGAVFFAHGDAIRETSWERGFDPRIQFSFSWGYDTFGQATTSLKIAAPRGWQSDDATDEFWVSYGETTYATPTGNRHIVDRTATETTYDVSLKTPMTVKELRSKIQSGRIEREPSGHTRSYYDGAAFVGLDLGTVGDRGALVRVETLVLTDRLLNQVYHGTAPYLSAANPTWPAEYPKEFRDLLHERAGYQAVNIAPLTGSNGPSTGYVTRTKRLAYDFQDDRIDTDSGLVVARKDPLGNVSRIEYDRYGVKPTRVKRSDGMITQATYDYAAMKPREITEPNGNRRGVVYTPLGMIAAEYERGAPDENLGETPDQPSVEYVYDLRAVTERNKPVSIHTIRRTKRRSAVISAERKRREAAGEPPLTDTDIAALFETERADHPDRFAEKREYSDGLGRAVQTRTKAEAIVHTDESGGSVFSEDQSDSDPGPVVATRPEGDDRVRVSGWQVFDNKGNVVREYRPFFDIGWSFRTLAATEADLPSTFDHRTDTYYDVLGRQIRTVSPNGAETREIRGTPHNLDDPDTFETSPWTSTSYDASDNAGRTHPNDGDRHRHDTPATQVVDPLGHITESTVRNRDADNPTGPIEELTTAKRHDSDGNLLSVVDPAGRTAFENRYDLAGNRIRTESIDSGVSVVVFNAAGNAIERRDGTGRLELTLYDAAGRVRRQWARDEADAQVTCRQRVVYGDDAPDLDQTAARDRNLLGRLYRRYDEAGVATILGYDFAGAPHGKERRPLATDYVGKSVNWTPGAGETLSDLADRLTDGETYETSFEYDAAGRVTVRRYPKDVDGTRSELRLRYTPSGSLAAVDMIRESAGGTETMDPYVEAIGYDARERRVLTVTGNGTMTRQTYDDVTGQLLRIRTESCRTSSPDAGAIARYEPTGTVHQDVAFDYGIEGNRRSIRDETPGSGVANAVYDDGDGGAVHGRDTVVRRFKYDAMGRLISATGRECRTIGSPRPWTDESVCGFDASPGGAPTVTRTNAPDQTSLYTEHYEYDLSDNMVSLTHSRHDPNGDVTFTRHFGHGGLASNDPATPGDNQLTHVGDDATPGSPTHSYDAVGNLIRDGNSTYTWDFANRLSGFEESAGNAISVRASYVYDAEGNRVTKIVEKGLNRRERTDYIDGVFERHRLERRRNGAWETATENDTLHVTDDGARIALRHIGTPFDGDQPFGSDGRPDTEYVYGDHAGNVSLVLDGDGGWYNVEEYTPFGETTFGSYARKRFRYAGRERDEESDLVAIGMRYYVPWLCRWTTTDPLGPTDDLNLYVYTQNDPVNRVDRNGGQTEERQEATSQLRTSGALMLTEEVDGVPRPIIDVMMEPMEIKGSIRGNPSAGSDSSGKPPQAEARSSGANDERSADFGEGANKARQGAIAARTAIGVAGAPKNMQGAPFGGPTNLFSGPGADEIAKLAPGSSIHDHAYYQDWEYWDKHLKHYYGKYGELGGMNYWDSQNLNIWGPASRDLGFGTGLSGQGIQTHGLHLLDDEVLQTRGNIQLNTEIPAYLKGSLVSGGLDVGGGALSIWSATYIDDPMIQAIGVGGGVAEIAGGSLRIGGAYIANSATTAQTISMGADLTLVGSGLARFGGGGGLLITSGYMLHQDYQKGDVVNGVGNVGGMFTGGAIIIGSGTASGVGASFMVGYGVGRLVDEYNAISMYTGKPLSTHLADAMFYVFGPLPL